VVIVIMAEKYGVDRREVFKAKAGGAMALGSGKGDRADPARPDGIGEQVEPLGLEKYGGVVDERQPQSRVLDAFWGFWRRR
jgi:hypothetical protein